MRHFVQDLAADQGARVKLRILATTDLHMNILPYDYHADRTVGGWGLSRTAQLIEAARDEAANVILLDNGDCLFGSALGEVHSAVADHQLHPMIRALNHLNYDAMNLGNHDFDQGRSALIQAIQGAGFPVLTANAVLPEEAHQARIAPFTLLQRKVKDALGDIHDLTIGVIGFLPPNSLHQARIATTDILEAARRYVPQMRAQGADVVIALAHSGLGAEAHIPDMENVLFPLSEVEGIDALIGGHTHQVFPAVGEDADSSLNGVPTVMPGFWGSHLGIIDLAIERCNGRWDVRQGSAGLRPVSDETPDDVLAKSSFEALFSDLHNRTREAMQARVGEAEGPLNNYLTLVGGDSATRLVQRAMLDHAQLCQEALGLPDLPILAASAAFKSGGFGGPDYYTALPSGALTQRSLADLYMFPNSFALVKATGAFLRNWLERSCSIFNQVLPGQKAVQLKDDGVPGYIYESVLGLTYEIDLTQSSRFTPSGALRFAEAGRIRSLQYNGRPVKEDDQFLLATTDYRVLGGGNYPIPDPSDILPVAPMDIRDLLTDYVANHGLIAIDAAPIWQFQPVPEASVWFRSSPKGQEAASEYPWLRLDVLDPCDTRGFTCYELAL
ncbi:bifunctional 2',3'-cyclic-nucleotide 2'-phosphodiesterase/3'-nucleotidase [Aliiroseovarius sp. S253]|uniref:bifunctional 2',3'-cyclic-nucleotide 2'-phosphodiesterase/3'-nucleotidase n=1 Tax=Aliiroseovarius sp. S253 TaxID=3415133 RepID=UPI003C7D55C7